MAKSAEKPAQKPAPKPAPRTNPAVDAYIEKALPFARPILNRIRRAVHKGCPGCVETIKWGMPSFDYNPSSPSGKGGAFCSMAAFKAHCAFSFWKAKLLEDPKGVLETEKRTAMGHLGRITSVDELPDDAVLVSLIKQAAKLNEDGVKVARVTTKKPPLKVPPAILAAIKRNKAALATWEAFAPSHKREYVEWITEAKTDATREKRMAQMLEQLADGKSRHWKYQK
jgi:uncharacterized protein YdeI (YjbR/CyaY-like superfamily)